MPVLTEVVLGLAVLLVSIIIHENAHGVTALALGDPTAKVAGRLTLNPVKHLDPVGSFILPALMYFSAGMMFGYAKPVPVNPSKLRGTDRVGFAVVAAAGPISNMILAFIAATLLAPRVDGPLAFFNPAGLYELILVQVITWNVLLAAFNILPIPPLDGSRFLRLFLSPNGRQRLDQVEPFGFLILLLAIVLLGEPFFQIVSIIFRNLLRLLPI